MEKIKKKKFNLRTFLKDWISGSNVDMFFLIVLLCLLAIGLVMVFSASFANAGFKYNDFYFYIKKQLLWAVIGLVAMFFVSKINYTAYKIFALPSYFISLALLLLVLLVGQGNYGEKRWIDFGFVNFQPSEFAKIAIIMLLALFISVNYNKMKRFTHGFLIPGVFIVVCAGLIVVEPHLSGAILVVSVGLVLMIIGGANLKYLGALGATAIAGAYFVITNTTYMSDRIRIWLNPYSDPRGKGFQTLQSLYAVGSGGFFGLGLGGSRQKYQYIPEPQNDFIFAIVCEELGFVGAMIIVALFVLLIYRGYVIAWHSPDKFGTLLVAGIITQIAIQTFLNISVVTNAIPVTGISLPFFSYGGTSLSILLAEMGIVLSVSRYSRLEKG